jgi:hypothetical protein
VRVSDSGGAWPRRAPTRVPMPAGRGSPSHRRARSRGGPPPLDGRIAPQRWHRADRSRRPCGRSGRRSPSSARSPRRHALRARQGTARGRDRIRRRLQSRFGPPRQTSPAMLRSRPTRGGYSALATARTLAPARPPPRLRAPLVGINTDRDHRSSLRRLRSCARTDVPLSSLRRAPIRSGPRARRRVRHVESRAAGVPGHSGVSPPRRSPEQQSHSRKSLGAVCSGPRSTERS